MADDSELGYGDRAGEFHRISRGQYHAGLYVGIGFLLVAAMFWVPLHYGTLALLESKVPFLLADRYEYNQTVQELGTCAAVVSAFIAGLVFRDRWRCIEATASLYCSGVMTRPSCTCRSSRRPMRSSAAPKSCGAAEAAISSRITEHMPPADDDAPIFLIGFMASGKTTVGRLLAERLDWTFVDLDKVIEDEAGRTIAEIFAAEGEAGFRQRETEALRGVAKRRKAVVATGGGAPCRDENMEAMLEAGRVFWLEVSAEEAVARAGKASGRPLLDGAADPVSAARKLLAARRPHYEKAHAGVGTVDQTPREIVDDLLRLSLTIGVLAAEERETTEG